MQKDLNRLQKTLEKEGDDLLKKIQKAAVKAKKDTGMSNKTREIEKLIETKIKKFEPALEKFYKEVKVSARKYGIDLTGLEEKMTTAKDKLAKKQTTKKKTTKKKTTKAKKKATTKTTSKTAAKKKTTKKKTTATKKKATKSTRKKT